EAPGAEARGGLHGALHRPAERDPALQRLRDRFRDQLRVELGLADLDDIDDHVGIGELRHAPAQLFDVGTLLADHHARTRRMDRHPGLLVRPLDHDLRHRGLLELLHQVVADFHVLVQQHAVAALAGVPARIPRSVDAETQPDRIYLLAHWSFSSYASALASTSRTTMVKFANGLKILPIRPRPRGVKRFSTSALPTCASATTRSSTSRSWLFSALAMADSRHLRTSRAIRLRENSRS